MSNWLMQVRRAVVADADRRRPEVTTLNVSGATLYYETQGTGPVLLMIPGGPADAGIFAGLARFLTDRYTVVA
jgi:pimeloyl-ACP methyl ester carboxylesterase